MALRSRSGLVLLAFLCLWAGRSDAGCVDSLAGPGRPRGRAAWLTWLGCRDEADETATAWWRRIEPAELDPLALEGLVEVQGRRLRWQLWRQGGSLTAVRTWIEARYPEREPLRIGASSPRCRGPLARLCVGAAAAVVAFHKGYAGVLKGVTTGPFSGALAVEVRGTVDPWSRWRGALLETVSGAEHRLCLVPEPRGAEAAWAWLGLGLAAVDEAVAWARHAFRAELAAGLAAHQVGLAWPIRLVGQAGGGSWRLVGAPVGPGAWLVQLLDRRGRVRAEHRFAAPLVVGLAAGANGGVIAATCRTEVRLHAGRWLTSTREGELRWTWLPELTSTESQWLAWLQGRGARAPRFLGWIDEAGWRRLVRWDLTYRRVVRLVGADLGADMGWVAAPTLQPRVWLPLGPDAGLLIVLADATAPVNQLLAAYGRRLTAWPERLGEELRDMLVVHAAALGSILGSGPCTVEALVRLFARRPWRPDLEPSPLCRSLQEALAEALADVEPPPVRLRGFLAYLEMRRGSRGPTTRVLRLPLSDLSSGLLAGLLTGLAAADETPYAWRAVAPPPRATTTTALLARLGRAAATLQLYVRGWIRRGRDAERRFHLSAWTLPTDWRPEAADPPNRLELAGASWWRVEGALPSRVEAPIAAFAVAPPRLPSSLQLYRRADGEAWLLVSAPKYAEGGEGPATFQVLAYCREGCDGRWP